jgi:hypothetical protein
VPGVCPQRIHALACIASASLTSLFISYTHLHTRSLTHTCTQARTHTCTQAHTHTRARTHTHTRTHALLSCNPPFRFTGCISKDCSLCKNNPNKRCLPGDNLDECYADNQQLRSKCEADVFVELVNAQTGKPMALPGMEVQVRCGSME